MGHAAVYGTIFGVMMKLYPEKVATIMSSNQMMFGLGYSLGPAIGGSLYNLSGFKCPYITLGIICLVNAFAQIFYIPGWKYRSHFSVVTIYLVLTIPDLTQDSLKGYEEVRHFP